MIPDSPDSDTERLLSPNADDHTQDGVDSELLLDDTPAETPMAMKVTETTTTMITTFNEDVSGGFIGDDVPLTCAEVVSDDPLPESSTAPPRIVPAVTSSVASITVDSKSFSLPASAGNGVIITNGGPPIVEDVRSSQKSSPVDDDVRDNVKTIDAAAAHLQKDTNCDAFAPSAAAVVNGNNSGSAELNGTGTENVDIAIVTNGTFSSCVIDHNLNEQTIRSTNGRKDGVFFLEKTRNEENRIQVGCFFSQSVLVCLL